jgi:hypothetical protein
MSVNNLVSAVEEKKLKKLLDEILKRRMQPEDMYEVAAIIESLGWNDQLAAQEFGVRDIFELAENLWNAITKKVTFTPYFPVERSSTATVFIEVIRSFIRGMVFALPMAISVVSMLTLRFSLWSYENLTLEMATSIAIGTIMSFMTVGGFTQAIARRGFFYITQNYYNMARRMTLRFIKIGYYLCLTVSILFLLFNLFFEAFPVRMIIVIVLYFFFLTAIWLSVTVMYILRKELAFTGLLVMGIALVFVMFELLELNIILSQIIALLVVSVSGIVLIMYFFKREEKKMEKGIEPIMPRMSITFYSVMPYFAYGFLYFTFLYVDRIMAWSTNDSSYMPYLIWFRGPYELGMDFALLMLIIPMGLIEVVVGKLMKDLEVSQKYASMEQAPQLARNYLIRYIKTNFLVMLLSLISSAVIYFIVYMVDQGSIALIETGFLSNNTTHFVFIWALIAYAFIVVALMNCIILFSLSQPLLVNRSLLPALIVNIVLGFLLSRWVDYSCAVLGLFFGAIVFLALTSRQVLKVIKNLDYYLYVAS